MRPGWQDLNEKHRAASRATIAFLKGRLEERETIDWALRLKPTDKVLLFSIAELVDSNDGRNMAEPWRSAWRLIEEVLDHVSEESTISMAAHDAEDRLRTGDRSGSLINAIVKLVAPRLEIVAFSARNRELRKLPKRPKRVGDLFSTRLTSEEETVEPCLLAIAELSDLPFLISLATALDAAVNNGLDIARRTGWDGEGLPVQLHRVYYVPAGERVDAEDEPDAYHRGLAPPVKLLHSVVSRIADIDTSVGIEFVHRWKLATSPINYRLWAALSRDPRITTAEEVGEFILSIDDRHFWELSEYPEIAELRARRFSELDPSEQTILTARIRRLPPRNRWPRKVDSDDVASTRLYWAIRELRRIEIIGGILPNRDKSWLDQQLAQFPDLAQMDRIDDGFRGAPEARSIPTKPDSRYDMQAGEVRLKSLEAALTSDRSRWHNDSEAWDWVRQQGNPSKILADLEAIPDGGSAFPSVWEHFGQAHSAPTDQDKTAAQRDLPAEVERVLTLLNKLPDSTIGAAINGMSQWLLSWGKQVVLSDSGIEVWLKLWPMAMEATNAARIVAEELDLDTMTSSSDGQGMLESDILITPAGKLISVFFAALPNLQENPHPFALPNALRTMRDAVIAATERSGLIARHRMIAHLPYFLKTDSNWTHNHLIQPLTNDSLETIPLWNAVAYETRFADVLNIIGMRMADRALDPRLGRETRKALVFSLVVECLHSFWAKRNPAIPHSRIQQMIRSLDDEGRAYGAAAVQRFVRDNSLSVGVSAERIFRSAAKPFFEQVWPQERSLVTPGVSKALARLPATAQDAFVEVVDVIDRFLVPFECWSLIDYGLHGEENGEAKISRIDGPDKAEALLRLLDRTIGDTERSVVPRGLADALEQIRNVSPRLNESQPYRRLAAAARRS